MTQAEDSQAPADGESELDAALRREAELRAALVEAHRQRLETEDRLAGRVDAALVEAEALRDQLARAEGQALAERVRRERLEQSPPMRALKGAAKLPLLRTIRARRAGQFQRALARARGEGG